MGAVKAVELAGILYSTFENVRGSVVECQYPKSCITTEQFKKIAHAIIPRADLTHQPITIEEFDHFIIGFPQRIESTQYKRNTLLFNVCFLLRPQNRTVLHDDLTGRHFCLDGGVSGLRPAVQVAYELTVRKINRYLAYLEEEMLVLSQLTLHKPAQPDDHTPESDPRLQRFLCEIWTGLRECGLCVANLNDDLPPLYLVFSPRSVNTSITSYFVPGTDELVGRAFHPSTGNGGRGSEVSWSSALPLLPLDSPQEVTDGTVFARVEPRLPRAAAFASRPTYALADSARDRGGAGFWHPCDLTSRRLLPLVDGCRSVGELARITVIDVNIARVCLSQLADVGAIREVSAPVFLASRLSAPAIDAMTSADYDHFLFSVPGYVGLPRLTHLTLDPTLAQACIDTVLLSCSWTSLLLPTTSDKPLLPHRDVLTIIHRRQLQTIFAILRVYSKLCASPYLNLPHLLSATQAYVDLVLPPAGTGGRSGVDACLGQLPGVKCPSHPIPRIDLLRLVQFGEVNGLIRRLHCYPISDRPSALKSGSYLEPSQSRKPSRPAVSQTPNGMSSGSQPVTRPNSQANRDKHMQIMTFQHQLWSLACARLMDGTASVDSIVFLLSGHVLRGIQNLTHSMAAKDWIPSQFSTLPDAVLTYTARLMLLVNSACCGFDEYSHKESSTQSQTSYSSSSVAPAVTLGASFSDENLLSHDILGVPSMRRRLSAFTNNFFRFESSRRTRIHQKEVVDLVNAIVPKLYILWH